MSDARSAILTRIRSALHTEPARPGASAEWAAIPRDYTQGSSASQPDLLERLTDRLLDYDSGVHRTSLEDLPTTLASILRQRGFPHMVVARGFPAAWLPATGNLTEDNGFSHLDLDGFDGVLTASTVSIAETGTIILQAVPGQGRRATTLIPDYHLCVVEAESVVATVPEAIARLAKTSALPTTFISGPSATADIEMTRIKGVHGPRFLDVVIMDARNSGMN